MKALLLSLACVAMVGCTSAGVQPDPSDSQITSTTGISNAEILYGYRCKGCHEPATPGAPDREELATFEQNEIVAALNRGAMKPFAPGLTKQDMRELAMYLTARTTKSR